MVLNESSAKEIFTLNRNEGRTKLAEYLGVQPLSLDTNSVNYFRVEYLYNVLIFITDRGFPWPHVCQCVSVCDEVLNQTADQNIVSAIQCFQQKSAALISLLGDRNYEILRDFVLSTYLTHYNLYHYVYKTTRATYIPSLRYRVDIPAETYCIRDAKPERIWKYDTALDIIKEKETAEQEHFSTQSTTLAEKVMDNKVKVIAEAVEPPFEPHSATREELEALIQSLSVGICDDLMDTVSLDIHHTYNSLAYKLQKTALARPTELGPPERYSVGNLPQSPKNTSAKNKRQAKSSAKAKK